MKARQAATIVLAGVMLLCFSQCATPPAASRQDQLHGEVHTELTTYRDDLINHPAPEYPVGPRGHRYQGIGVYRIKFDYDSGRATSVAVVRTSGQVLLDQSAIEALGKMDDKAA